MRRGASMRINLNGWKLIGIVVSVVWFVGFFLNQWHSRVTGVLDLYTIELIARTGGNLLTKRINRDSF